VSAGAAPPLIAVVGATGTGKSELALDLAEHLRARGRPAEIVGADAMQLYRGMDIGTAKVPVGARRGIPHHLIDVLDPADDASVADYRALAVPLVDDLRARGVVPVLVGGSGLYVSSVLHEFAFPARDDAARARLEEELERHGPGLLHRRLAGLDPEAAAAIDPRNGRRVVRALEVVETTGRPFRAGLPDETVFRVPSLVIGLEADRAPLTARLDARVEGMWAAGIVDEVRHLELGTTAARAIGYAQALDQLRGELTEAEAITATQALTRRYARRQVSWFRRSPQVRWLEVDAPADPDAPAADPRTRAAALVDDALVRLAP